jgi:L-glyceraldehyde 3-phosphate reductase
VLRDPRVTSAIVGASSVEQLEDNVRALSKLEFDPDELTEIDRCLAQVHTGERAAPGA